jgi:APA family basic amino acid/polyamine antiporter
MALTFAAYVVPSTWQKPIAIAVVAALATVNYFGITRTIRMARYIVAFVLVVLSVVVAAATGALASGSGPASVLPSGADAGWYGAVQSAGLLFFAFAGYARLATLGEEVLEPRRTIPRAILTSLAITLAVYAAIAVAVLTVLGSERLAAATAPLVDVVRQAGWNWSVPLVTAGAAAASLGALLALIAGVGRTTLAMARHHDLPQWLSAVHPRYAVPHRAEVVIAVIVCGVIAVADLRGAIGFSSFGVLLYYAIANVAATTQAPEDRLYPRSLPFVGAALCLCLMATLPIGAVIGGVLVLAAGIVVRAARLLSPRVR